MAKTLDISQAMKARAATGGRSWCRPTPAALMAVTSLSELKRKKASITANRLAMGTVNTKK